MSESLERDATAILASADAALQAGNFEDARDALGLLADNPQADLASELRARAESGDWEAARSSLARALVACADGELDTWAVEEAKNRSTARKLVGIEVIGRRRYAEGEAEVRKRLGLKTESIVHASRLALFRLGESDASELLERSLRGASSAEEMQGLLDAVDADVFDAIVPLFAAAIDAGVEYSEAIQAARARLAAPAAEAAEPAESDEAAAEEPAAAPEAEAEDASEEGEAVPEAADDAQGNDASEEADAADASEGASASEGADVAGDGEDAAEGEPAAASEEADASEAEGSSAEESASDAEPTSDAPAADDAEGESDDASEEGSLMPDVDVTSAAEEDLPSRPEPTMSEQTTEMMEPHPDPNYDEDDSMIENFYKSGEFQEIEPDEPAKTGEPAPARAPESAPPPNTDNTMALRAAAAVAVVAVIIIVIIMARG